MVIGRKPEAISVRTGPGMPARLVDDPSGLPAPPTGGGGGGGRRRRRPNRLPARATRSESFNRPTDIAFDKGGNVYIADGMGNNNRIAMFNARRQLGERLGPDRIGAGPVQHDPRHCQRPGRQHLRGGCRQQAHPGLRRPGHLQVADYRHRDRRRRSASRAARRSISTARTRTIQRAWRTARSTRSQLDGQVVGQVRQGRQAPSEFGMVNSLDCRTEKTLLGRRSVELAGAEGDAEAVTSPD